MIINCEKLEESMNQKHFYVSGVWTFTLISSILFQKRLWHLLGGMVDEIWEKYFVVFTFEKGFQEVKVVLMTSLHTFFQNYDIVDNVVEKILLSNSVTRHLDNPNILDHFDLFSINIAWHLLDLKNILF